MQSSLFDQGASVPCPNSFNLADYVLAAGQNLLDKPALVIAGPSERTEWTFGQLTDAVQQAAGVFTDYGLHQGDRIFMRIGNTVDFPIIYLGAIYAGFIPVVTSPLLTANEITKLAAIVMPSLIVAAKSITLPDFLSCPVIDVADIRKLDATSATPSMGDPNRPAYIIFTSGTSGQAKAVTHAHRAIWARQMMLRDWYDLHPKDRLMHAGAFNWTYTLGTGLMDPWSRGATAVIPVDGTPVDALPQIMADESISIFAAAPGVYRRLLRNEIPSLSHLRHGLSAGEKLSERIRQDWNSQTGTQLHEAFGMSECSTFISGSPGHPAKYGTLGRPQTGRRISIRENDEPVPLGETGTLSIHKSDPGLMIGYWDPSKQRPAPLNTEWFQTGDEAAMGPDFSVTYHGRRDDMMNAGGFRVSPAEVEAVLNTHPKILESAAAEYQVKADTSVIALFYTGAEDLLESDLQHFASDRLARYKIPRLFKRVSTLPRNTNGKILRRALRNEKIT